MGKPYRNNSNSYQTDKISNESSAVSIRVQVLLINVFIDEVYPRMRNLPVWESLMVRFQGFCGLGLSRGDGSFIVKLFLFRSRSDKWSIYNHGSVVCHHKRNLMLILLLQLFLEMSSFAVVIFLWFLSGKSHRSQTVNFNILLYSLKPVAEHQLPTIQYKRVYPLRSLVIVTWFFKTGNTKHMIP